MWCVMTGIPQLNDLSQCSVQTTNSSLQTPGYVPKKTWWVFLDEPTYKPGKNPGPKLKQIFRFYATILKKYFTRLKDVNV